MIVVFWQMKFTYYSLSVVSPMLLYKCWSSFSCHSRAGGNPGLFVFEDKWIPDYNLGNDNKRIY